MFLCIDVSLYLFKARTEISLPKLFFIYFQHFTFSLCDEQEALLLLDHNGSLSLGSGGGGLVWFGLGFGQIIVSVSRIF